MQKFIEKSINHLTDVFPSIYENREKKGSFHCSFAYSKNRLIAIGLNQNEKVNCKSYKLARRHNLLHRINFPYLHSEEALIARLIAMDKISPSTKIVVLRMNRFLELKNSRPCPHCRLLLSAYGLNRVWFSNQFGKIEQL